MSESDVAKECVKYMRKRGWRAHRLHCGEFFTRGGHRIYGEDPGTSDYLFVQPDRAVYVEFKRPRGVRSPKQREFIAKMHYLRFTAGFVDSIDALRALVGD